MRLARPHCVCCRPGWTGPATNTATSTSTVVEGRQAWRARPQLPAHRSTSCRAGASREALAGGGTGRRAGRGRQPSSPTCRPAPSPHRAASPGHTGMSGRISRASMGARYRGGRHTALPGRVFGLYPAAGPGHSCSLMQTDTSEGCVLSEWVGRDEM